MAALLMLLSVGRAGANEAVIKAPAGKPWLDDYGAFASANAGERWVVGRSTGPCLSEQEAADEAARDAVGQVYDRMVRKGMVRRAGDEAWVRARLMREMAVGDLIADRAVVRNERPYGEIWSEAILVKASDRRFAGVVRELEARQRVRHAVMRGAVGAGFVVMVVIALAYVVVNWLTRGYFRGRLRAGAGLAFGLSVVLIVWVVRAVG
jgi:hypothetical protein